MNTTAILKTTLVLDTHHKVYSMKKNYIIGTLVLTIGIILVILSLVLSLADRWFIELVTGSLASGVSPLYFQQYANGIMAGGVIKVIPFYLVTIPALLGGFLSYYGTYVLINSNRASATIDMFKKEYWTEYQAKLAYKDRSIKKIEIIKKKSERKTFNDQIKTRR